MSTLLFKKKFHLIPLGLPSAPGPSSGWGIYVNPWLIHVNV